ncbi:nucleoside-diphosphate kinase [Salimicrobium jeotgali]|uniref:Nucleoside diphosphate kinase n=2 Tax=Salimicrobium TaxID=351195 RepID=K2FP17_9BACI|nr:MULTISPECIES: nucleoside-diphosphate kinase [Salimicrobium]AKG04408.1 nucleoside-diphosphate kinase [Salimicrobium jeotgali]EKE32601.1 mulitfunctional nucleoside diphosphate kinase/apyrimidinic endonuclease/3'-phosphodiesterase [Salimicrobium jeotgali]MBM7695416.1 nucleoside-diphosphate kinase [Salimicrobium jeotgali]SIS55975.1 nucleoside diphosphate kinase [Salimicrobium salexigens]
MERTFIMVKPDGVQRNLVGEIVSRFEKKGLKLVYAEMTQVTEQLASEHYAEHKDKPFFKDLVGFITSNPSFAMVWEGENAIAIGRKMMGATNPKDSEPGTIRGDFGLTVGKNVIHGSDSQESAEREIALFAGGKPFVDYEKDEDKWIY